MVARRLDDRVIEPSDLGLDSGLISVRRSSVGVVLYDLSTSDGRLAYHREVSAILDPWLVLTPSEISGFGCEGDVGYVSVSLPVRLFGDSN